jgi:hypothetical protein
MFITWLEMQAELERLLLEARADGVARPEILDTFNAQREGEKEYVLCSFRAYAECVAA